MQKITLNFVRQFKPKDKRYDFNKDNLEVIVHPTGRVTFNSVTKLKGKKARDHLGSFPSCDAIEPAQVKAMMEKYAENFVLYAAGKRPDTPQEEAVKQARARAAKREELERGKRYRDEEEAEKRRQAEGGWELYAEENPEDTTFSTLFWEWAKAEGQNKKSFHNDERIFNTHLKPLQSIPAVLIDRDRLVTLLRGVPGKVQPNRVRALLSKVFNWGFDNNMVADGRVVHRLPAKKESKRTRFMTDVEIAKAWPVMRPIHRFLLLTAQRREEVAAMKWEHLDGDQWMLPETKNSFPHLLTLPKFALEQLPDREGIWVWKQKRSKKNPDRDLPIHPDTVTDWWNDARDGVNLSDVRVHDFRRTAITNLTRVTKDDTIGRKVANQALGGVKKVYDLYQWDDEKRDALKKWSAHVGKVLK